MVAKHWSCPHFLPALKPPLSSWWLCIQYVFLNGKGQERKLIGLAVTLLFQPEGLVPLLEVTLCTQGNQLFIYIQWQYSYLALLPDYADHKHDLCVS